MDVAKLQKITAAEAEEWITARIAEFVNITVDKVSRDASFESFGIDSGKAIELMTGFEDWLDLPDELPLELLFEAESIAQASENIAAEVREMAARNPQYSALQ